MQLPNLFASLLVRPRPLDLESRWGFWLRLADENGLRRPQWLLAPGTRWASGKTRVCPKCLQAAKAHWRGNWDEPDVYWCALHMTWLVDECPACHRRFRWDCVRFLDCSCGYDLRAIDTVAVDERLLGNVDTGTTSLPTLRILGAFALFGSSGKPGKKADRSSLSEVRAQVEAGADLVEGWPSTLVEALDRHRTPVANKGTAQLLAEAFPRLRELCGLIPDGVWRGRVEDVIRDYCANSLSGSAPILGRNAVFRAGPMTLKQVATRLGTRVELVARAFDAHGEELRGKRVTAHGRQRRIVGEKDLPRLSALLRERITATEAARLLALPVARVRAMVRSGLLYEVNGGFGRSQVEAFAKRPVRGSQLTAETPGQQLPVRLVLRAWVRTEDTTAFLRALLSGELEAKGGSDFGAIGAWLMTAADAEAWARKRRLEERDAMTLTRAAQVLAVKYEVARDLLRAGLLSARRGVLGGRQAWWIAPSDLQAFKERYVPLAHLAKEAGIRSRDGLEWAQHLGLSVVTGPRVDGARQYFVDRRSFKPESGRGRPAGRLHAEEVY